MLTGATASLLASTAFAAEPHVAPMTDFANSTVKQWIADNIVIEAIKAQNAKHAGLSQGDIDKLDQDWRAQTDAGSKPMIDAVLGNALSAYLVNQKNGAQGLVTEVFVMDNRGLNVGQSDVTSDFWQGDEAKWQKTYSAGPGAIFVDEVEMDESTQTFQSQLSMSIIDPASGDVIGAITVGINVDAL
ncbi:hypothetical protein HBA54_12950 [Pelagibius litoralis]|uniref:Uncharacterized protein n=1 Tax=Pelagibius litoralis TaxID=374515 RepID=A0A967EXZ9_9PROT|nr:hypothetical protein [Pelagibius litoralis]